MFSSDVLITIANAIKFLDRTNLFPFSWDGKENTLTRASSKTRTFWTKLFLLHYIGYFLYNIYQLYHAFCKKSEISIMDTIWVGLFAGGHYISFEGMLNPYLKQKAMVTHFRQMVIFEKYQKTLQLSDISKRWKFGEKLALLICRSHVGSCLTLTFMAPILYYFKSRGPQYIYSAWTGNEKSVYVLFFAYELFCKCMNGSSLFLSQAWFIFSVAYLTLGISNLRQSTDALSKKATYFRCLYLLNGAHNRCYVVTLLPFRFAFYGQFLVGCAFVMIHMRSRVSLIERVVMSQILLAFMVAPLLYLHISGKVLKDSWTIRETLRKEAYSLSTGERKVWRREIRSLMPFGVNVGTIRAISFAALSAFFVTVCSVLTTLLVAAKEY